MACCSATGRLGQASITSVSVSSCAIMEPGENALHFALSLPAIWPFPGGHSFRSTPVPSEFATELIYQYPVWQAISRIDEGG